MSIQIVVDHLRSEGFPISELIPDGKIHRFEINPGDRNAGFYLAFRNFSTRTSQEVIFVKYGSWIEGIENARTYSTYQGDMTPGEKKDDELRKAAAKRAFEKEKELKFEETANVVSEIWNKLATSGSSAYLDRKHISQCPNLNVRFDNFDKLIYVPVRDENGKLWSFETIKEDGSKRSFPGGKKKSNYHVIGDPYSDDNRKFYISEGMATAASVHMATGTKSVCTFGFSNLREVASIFRKEYPESEIIITGDIGKEIESQQAAISIGGIAVFPQITNRDPKETDWNDLHVKEGIEKVIEQLSVVGKPTDIELVSAYDIINQPFPDENETTFARKSTIRNVAELLKRLKIIVRYNVISKEEEILIPNASFSVDNMANASLAHITSWAERVKIPTGNLTQYLTAIADANQYNPVVAWIRSVPWDGTPRLEALYETVKSKNEPLKKILIRKWMISAVAAAFLPEGVSAHGVLVFQGKQYLGKTMWFKRLCPESLRADGMSLKTDDKDSVFQVISKWLIELGELDATFRQTDIAQLKSFFPKNKDILRRPYAKKESNFARRTVFFASVNEIDFLKDPTGNRRYWTIECENINHGHNINVQQLWAEVEVLFRKGESWLLNDAEHEELNKHNENFESLHPVEERVKYRFEWAKDLNPRWMTATEVCKDIGIDNPSQQDTRAASRILGKLSKKTRTKDGYKQFMVPERTALGRSEQF